MARGVDETESIGVMYSSGMSIPMINKKTGIPTSTIRNRLKRMGILRTRAEGIRLAFSDNRVPSKKGKARKPFSQEWKDNISKGRTTWGEANAKGVSLKPNGYFEYTRGEHKGRLVHVVKMEKRLGRRLKTDECVHHIDRNKQNNSVNNLALLTKSAHARLHQFEDALEAKQRRRNANGTWC